MIGMSLLTPFKQDSLESCDLSEISSSAHATNKTVLTAVPAGRMMFHHRGEHYGGEHYGPHDRLPPGFEGADASVEGWTQEDGFKAYYNELEMLVDRRAKEIGKWDIGYTVITPERGRTRPGDRSVVLKDIHHGQLREAVNKAVIRGRQLYLLSYRETQTELNSKSITERDRIRHVACKWEVLDPATASTLALGNVASESSSPAPR